MSAIFRQDALERLRNPERLDTLMEVTSMKGWIGLAAMGTVIAAALAWSIIGRLPDTVTGEGVMLREGGLYAIQSMGNGAVREVLAPLGAEVKQGDVVARIAQPDLELTIRGVQTQLEAARANREDMGNRLDRSTRLEVSSLGQQRRQFEQSIRELQARIQYLDGRVEAERVALERGLITGDVYQGTVAQRVQAQDQLVSTQVQLEQLAGREVTLQTEAVSQVFSLDAQIRDLEAQLALYQQQLEDQGAVRSPYDGIVVEQLVTPGEAVAAGQTILNIEFLDVPLQVLLFTGEGKRVAEGMRVQLLPTGVRAEEHGYIEGLVEDVSQNPLSPVAMNRYLRNDALVQRFSGTGAAYLVDVEAQLDPTTPSGFKWTTREGPDMRLGSGAILSGKVTVGDQAPITLVIPTIRKWLGI